jgi:hypothetical protein
MTPAPDFAQFGFSNPTPRFVRVTTCEDDAGRAHIEGVVVIPGLPVCRVQVAADVRRFDQFGPGRPALLGYVRAALHEDVVAELPWN